jgi:hypothetical protein
MNFKETPIIERYIWLNILKYSEHRKTNLNLKYAFCARWTLPLGTAATPPPPPPS